MRGRSPKLPTSGFQIGVHLGRIDGSPTHQKLCSGMHFAEIEIFVSEIDEEIRSDCVSDACAGAPGDQQRPEVATRPGAKAVPRVEERGEDGRGLELVLDEVQNRDGHQRDRLAEVQHLPHHRRREDGLGIPQVIERHVGLG